MKKSKGAGRSVININNQELKKKENKSNSKTTGKSKKNAGKTNSKSKNRNSSQKSSKSLLNKAVAKKTRQNAVTRQKQKKTKAGSDAKLKIIPIGGLSEIGKNITVLEYKDEIIIIDCGMSFPGNEMYGIDIVIPDFTYLIENRKKIKGLFITHGHEDHIGAVPYLLKQIDVPVFGTRLTLGLIEHKLEEHGIKAQLNSVTAGSKVKRGVFTVEFIRTTHSIADAVCLSIDTPVGKVFHTGDFKVDFTPVDGEPIDFAKLAEIGKKGVTLMLADSTNAVRPGFTESEKVVGQTLEDIFRDTRKRIIIATFSSNVHRLQKIIDIAVLCKRRVAFSGRSMLNVVSLATELGYLKIPENMAVDINNTKKIPDQNLIIITTGSQGEPMAALSRMAKDEHKSVHIKKGDCIVLSSSPIPGNEKTVSNVVNRLLAKGADVIYSDIADTHVSGHACREELKIIHSLIKPKYFMPVHGEMKHLMAHRDIAIDLGMEKSNIFLLNNGDELEISRKRGEIHREVAPAAPVLVDGLGVGDVGNAVLKDRRLLAESGLIIVAASIELATNMVVSGPDIVSKGLVYVKENEQLIEGARKAAIRALAKCETQKVRDRNAMKSMVKNSVANYIYEKTGRRPVVLPIFMEV